MRESLRNRAIVRLAAANRKIHPNANINLDCDAHCHPIINTLVDTCAQAKDASRGESARGGNNHYVHHTRLGPAGRPHPGDKLPDRLVAGRGWHRRKKCLRDDRQFHIFWPRNEHRLLFLSLAAVTGAQGQGAHRLHPCKHPVKRRKRIGVDRCQQDRIPQT